MHSGKSIGQESKTSFLDLYLSAHNNELAFEIIITKSKLPALVKACLRSSLKQAFTFTLASGISFKKAKYQFPSALKTSEGILLNSEKPSAPIDNVQRRT